MYHVAIHQSIVCYMNYHHIVHRYTPFTLLCAKERWALKTTSKPRCRTSVASGLISNIEHRLLVHGSCKGMMLKEFIELYCIELAYLILDYLRLSVYHLIISKND